MTAAPGAGARRIEVALLSVGDKRGVAALARGLVAHGVTVVATTGTWMTLVSDGVSALSLVHDLDLPPALDGRLRTLDPGLHAAIAATTDELPALAELDLAPIDLVVVVPRSFAITSARSDATLAMAIEDVDTGGVALLRAAARNHDRVAVVADPDDYAAVMAELDDRGGALSAATRRRLAARAFAIAAAYDARVASFLADRTAAELREPSTPVAHHRLGALVTGPWIAAPLGDSGRLAGDLGLYGEPPHPLGVLEDPRATVVAARALGGASLDAAAVGDADRALTLCRELAGPAVVLVRGGAPVWAAVGDVALRALSDGLAPRARAPRAALALDQRLTAALATSLVRADLAAVIVPAVDDEVAAAWPTDGPTLLVASGRWHEGPWAVGLPALAWRSIAGGLLVQEADVAPVAARLTTVMTTRRLAADDERDLELAGVVSKHAGSQSLVLARGGETLKIVFDQPDLARAIAVAALGPDGAFARAVAATSAVVDDPADLDALAHTGVRALLQPGGSARDMEVVAAARRLDLALHLSGLTHHRR